MQGRVRILAWLSIAFASLAANAQQPVAPWRVGAPIIGYWNNPAFSTSQYFPPGTDFTILTEDIAARTAAAGFNVVWVNEADQLPLAQKHGLRAQMVIYNHFPAHAMFFYGCSQDPDPQCPSTLPARKAAFIAAFRDSPAAYSYYVADEPNARSLTEIARIVNELRSQDPAHLGYVDLFPPGTTVDLLCSELPPGDPRCTPTYSIYLQQYLNTVQPSLLGYNDYQLYFAEPGASCSFTGDRDNFLSNMQTIAIAARSHSVPFLPVIQGSAFEKCWVNPDAAKLRFLSNTTLAFGAAGVLYWNYWTIRGPSTGGIAPFADGSPSTVYTDLSVINPRYFRVALQLQKTHWIYTYLKGYKLQTNSRPYLTFAPPSDASIRLTNIPDTENYIPHQPLRGILTGYFGDPTAIAQWATHLYAVNLDYANSRSISVAGDFPLSTFDADRNTWVSRGASFSMILDPGAAVLVAKTAFVNDNNPWRPAVITAAMP